MVYLSMLLGSVGRFWRSKMKRFGVFEVVGPVETTPSRNVPEHIEKPNYKKLIKLSEPEIKDMNKIFGMKRSCKLASDILAQVQKAVKVLCTTVHNAHPVYGHHHRDLDMTLGQLQSSVIFLDIAIKQVWLILLVCQTDSYSYTRLPKPGITTDDIDEFVHNLTIEAGAYPSPLHYSGFPKSVCTSVNNVCVHGIPDIRPLQDGDIVNVDITVYFKGFHGDCSKTFLVGDVDDLGHQIVSVTEECLDIAIRACGPNVPFNEIGHTIEKHAKRNGLTVLPAFLGHGIGEYFHGPPDIYHMTNDYKGVMKAGMTFTIEPVLSHGSVETVMLEDNWTVITEDNSRAAQVEHTILITENGAEILTK